MANEVNAQLEQNRAVRIGVITLAKDQPLAVFAGP
jgi:hypothetical protein